MAFYIRYGVGGGFGGCGDWELARWSTTIDQAENEALAAAREDYESYGGLHGLFDYDEYMRENPEATDEDAEIEREQDIDSWVEYEAIESDINPDEED